MKILNQTTRATSSSIQRTRISDLTETTELDEKSIIHIAQKTPGGGENYESMKMTVGEFQKKMYQSVQNTLKTEYWDTHCDPTETTHTEDVETDINAEFPKGTSFKELIDYLGEYNSVSNNKIWQPTQTEYEGMSFVNHVYYDFDVVKRYMVKKDNELQDKVDLINGELSRFGCSFNSHMKLFNDSTELSSSTVDENVDVTECQMEIKDGNKISNTWITPASGNLVVYGWLDSSEALNNRATPSAFCVLEANINSTSDRDNWEIISVQPVTPFKTITYVGFNVPVKKGLALRVHTGFTCGAKSGAHSNTQDGNDTLSNSTSNGFKCMVYCHEKYERESE